MGENRTPQKMLSGHLDGRRRADSFRGRWKDAVTGTVREASRRRPKPKNGFSARLTAPTSYDKLNILEVGTGMYV